MNSVVEQMLIKSNEQKKKDRKMLSNVERACKCGTMVIMANRTPSQKRYGKIVCIECERKRKEKYKNK